MKLKDSELILNDDGSIYHLNLKPENISNDIIFVGDPERVNKVTQHFDSIEFSTHKREFKTTTGRYKNKRITVISTGIGADNIDIVLNEFLNFHEIASYKDAANSAILPSITIEEVKT